jgi:hypothetical protein
MWRCPIDPASRCGFVLALVVGVVIWRDLDVETREEHMVDATAPQAAEACGDLERIDADERWHVAPAFVMHPQAGAGHVHDGQESQRHGVELDLRVESVAERHDDSVAECIG